MERLSTPLADSLIAQATGLPWRRQQDLKDLHEETLEQLHAAGVPREEAEEFALGQLIFDALSAGVDVKTVREGPAR